MRLELKPFDFAAAAAKAGLGVDGRPLKAGAVPAAAEEGSFKVAIQRALGEVSESQLKSSELQRQVQLGNPEVSLEETMVAMQKSQLGFQAALSVRNRLVQAYSEIMNMQV